MAAQVKGPVTMPIRIQRRREKAQPVTDELKKFSVYCHLRRVRADTRLKGKRDKKATEAAEEGLGKARWAEMRQKRWSFGLFYVLLLNPENTVI